MRQGIRHLRQKYMDLSFRRKLFLMFFLICALPIAVFQMVSMQISVRHLNTQIDTLMTENLHQTAERASLILDAYTTVIYQIYTDDTIEKDLSAYHDAGTMEQTALFFSMNEKIKQFAEIKNGIRCISLICRTGESVTYDKQTGSVLDNIWRDYEDLREIEPYRLTHGRQGVTLIPTRLIQDNEDKAPLFFLGKDIYSSNHMDHGAVATVVMGISSHVLDEICQNGTEDSGGVSFIVDDSATLISFPDEYYLGSTIKDAKDACSLVQKSRIMDKEKQNLACSSYYDKETGFTFYNVYDYDAMMRPIMKVQWWYRLLLLLDLILVVLLVILVSSSFAGFLRKIIDGIHQVESGNFDVQIVIDRHDEFGQIGEHFNTMTKEVKTLMQEVVDISEKKNQAQIRALESQINPHFLYNTLDAINWMALDKEEDEISRMIGNLGFILRYTMNQSNAMVTVTEVERWLQSYVALYQLRYRHSFSFQISVEPEVAFVRIYKLLLQPVIENAILHGIKEVEGGMIRVDIGKTDGADKIYIIVEDNGCGMDEEKVERYNDRNRKPGPDEHIGLANVFERIELYYGEEGSWHITSVKGIGTTVEILLPYVTEEGISYDKSDREYEDRSH